MFQYILRRVVLLVPTLIGMSVAIFGLMHLLPGDPAIAIIGPEATQDQIEQIHREYGLDQPLVIQYFCWIRRLISGDLGRSIVFRDSVSRILLRALPVTVELAASALIIALFISIPVGIVSALKRETLLDNVIRTLSFVGACIPNFWLGIMLILLFGVRLQVLPIYGYVSISRDLLGNITHMILPATTLGTSIAAFQVRITRSCVLEVMNADYIRTAHAKGLSERKVIYVHTLKNAMITILTVVGLQLGALLGGSVLTETVFALPGLGKLVVDSVGYRDYQVVQGVVTVYALMFAVVNLLVDLLYGYLDPRIRYD